MPDSDSSSDPSDSDSPHLTPDLKKMINQMAKKGSVVPYTYGPVALGEIC